MDYFTIGFLPLTSTIISIWRRFKIGDILGLGRRDSRILERQKFKSFPTIFLHKQEHFYNGKSHARKREAACRTYVCHFHLLPQLLSYRAEILYTDFSHSCKKVTERIFESLSGGRDMGVFLGYVRLVKQTSASGPGASS